MDASDVVFYRHLVYVSVLDDGYFSRRMAADEDAFGESETIWNVTPGGREVKPQDYV